MGIMNNQRNNQFGHFENIWTEVILDTNISVVGACSDDFKSYCNFEILPLAEWKKSLDRTYHRLLRELKVRCYGATARDARMDYRKLAAVICATVITEKPYVFDLPKAQDFLLNCKQNMTPVERNRWAADHLLINYKMAFYAGLQMVYLALQEELFNQAEMESDDRADACARLLNQYGHLIPYQRGEKERSETDSFDVNMIFGLAWSDRPSQGADMFFLAMQYYQIEMYTREKLFREIKNI